MNQLGHFEEQLLTELRQVVAERAAAAPRPGRSRGRLVLATAGAGLLAAALVFGVPAVNGDRTPAAHAVTSNDDGSVTITVTRLEDPEGLERQLAAHGITADVSFAPPDKMCRPGRVRFDREPSPLRTARLMVAEGSDVLTLDPAETEGRTLVLEGRDGTLPQDETRTFVITHLVVSGPVAPCELVDVPAA